VLPLDADIQVVGRFEAGRSRKNSTCLPARIIRKNNIILAARRSLKNVNILAV